MPSSSLEDIVACFGQPVAGNPTQFMMERAFAQRGLDWRYLTLEVAPADLAAAVAGAKAMGFRGFNCTIPHKCAVIEHLDVTTQAAGLMGAVNCVFREDDRWVGENTDGKGFVESLRTLVDPAGKKIVLLGAGGAARAIGVELGLAGAADITVVNRTAQRGAELAGLLSEKVKVSAHFAAWEGNFDVPAGTDVLIDATSIGLGDAQARVPLNVASLAPETIVADVIFNPCDTWLLRTARERGCRTLDGLGMLVNQALLNFKIWTGVDADASVMRDALEEYLAV